MRARPGARRLDALRPHAARLVALALILVAYGFTRLPRLPADERARLAERFRFEQVALPAAPAREGEEPRSIREVHPSLARLAAWISSVGAAVALHDLTGDGLPNDACLVDVRTDRVLVAPVVETDRYPPFPLDEAPLPYDPATMAPMGCIPGDLNEDGLPDLLVYYWGRAPVAFLRRAPEAGAPGDGSPARLSAADFRPVEVAPVPGGEPERWFTNAATRADLDGDGHADLVIGNYFQDGARILDSRAGGTEAMQHSMSRAFNAGRNRILRWTGGSGGPEPTVTFEEVEALDDEVAHGWTLALGAADLDRDLLPEIYFANDFGPDRLLHNRSRPGEIRFAVVEGRRTLRTVRSKVLGHDSFKGMGVDFADLNDDGLLDLYVSNIAAMWSLEESHFLWLSTGETEAFARGVAPYVDRSETLGLSRSGWGWETRFGDFDNDGSPEVVQATGFVKGTVNRWPELHELAMGNDELLRRPGSWPRLVLGDDLSGYQRNPFFVRSAGGRYHDLAADVGLAEPHVTRGVATADVDGDGRLDFAVANQWEGSFLYLNRAPRPGAFLGLHLLHPLEPGATRHRPGPPGPDTRGFPAVGAEAVVRLPGGGSRVAQVDGGNGHSGVRSPELHFGLGGELGTGPGPSP
ncbi:MAG TPA: CRTAC1 family protein, partial [Thermoanaerobaculia bacterium]|nr:CRTAC1 family protein [Thermoanaerobaculia bacterium]